MEPVEPIAQVEPIRPVAPIEPIRRIRRRRFRGAFVPQGKPAAAAVAAALTLQLLALLPSAARAVVVDVHTRIDVNLSDADLEGFWKAFGQLAGAKIVLDPSLDLKKKISIRLDNVTVRTALSAACDSIGCLWSVKDDALLIRPRPAPSPREADAQLTAPVDLKIHGANVGEVMATIAQILGVDLALDESLAAGALSLEIESQPVSFVLDAACASLNCRWKLEPGEKRQILRVQAATR